MNTPIELTLNFSTAPNSKPHTFESSRWQSNV